MTLGAWINGGVTGIQGICYVVFQVMGAAMGAMIACGPRRPSRSLCTWGRVIAAARRYAIAANGAITFPHPQAAVPQPSFSAVVAEAVYTFALVFVVLSVTAKVGHVDCAAAAACLSVDAPRARGARQPRFPNVYFGLVIGGTLLAGVEVWERRSVCSVRAGGDKRRGVRAQASGAISGGVLNTAVRRRTRAGAEADPRRRAGGSGALIHVYDD